MTYIFELLKNRTGFSRIGRIQRKRNGENIYNYTPDIVIQLDDTLLHNFNFLREFSNPQFLIISEKKHLSSSLLEQKFENQYFIYTHYGKLDKFISTLDAKLQFITDNNILCLIPFNLPTRAISKDFAEQAIKSYLQNVRMIIERNPSLKLGISIRLFGYSELITHYVSFLQKEQKIKLVKIEDLFNKLRNFRTIISVIIELKDKTDNNLILLADGEILPDFYPMLIYFGFDLINTSYLSYLSFQEKYVTQEKTYYFDQLEYLPCSCRICREDLKYIKKGSREKRNVYLSLYLHNLIFVKFYMQKIKQKLKKEDYRNFLEKSSFHNLNAISTLKVLDKEYNNRLEKETPITQKNRILKCIGPSSYYRPDFTFYRKRVIERFHPEPYSNIIVLFPCSAKKPYSKSKSHRKFLHTLGKFKNQYAFQEFILTSPLGVIPRQYENLYPACFYDISVTGDWDHEEIEIGGKMLASLLEKYDPKIPIIAHVSGGYKKIIEATEKFIQRTIEFPEIDYHPTSKKSLASLESLVESKLTTYRPSIQKPESQYLFDDWNRKLVKILDYQFGKGTGKKFFQNPVKSRINRRHQQIHFSDPTTEQELGVFKEATGQFKISIAGANRIKPWENSHNIVVFNGENLRGNTFFKPGILEYSEDLYPNEIVFILNKTKEKVVGVGKMIVGSKYIKNTQSGRVIKLYETID